MATMKDRLNKSKPTEIVSKPIAADTIKPKYTEKPGPLGVIHDILKFPTKKNILPVEIGGIPIDWHMLEKYTLAISPYKFVNLLKLNKRMVEQQSSKYTRNPMGIKGKTLMIFLILGILAVMGVIILMFKDDIAMAFKGMMGMFGG